MSTSWGSSAWAFVVAGLLLSTSACASLTPSPVSTELTDPGGEIVVPGELTHPVSRTLVTARKEIPLQFAEPIASILLDGKPLTLTDSESFSMLLSREGLYRVTLVPSRATASESSFRNR